MAKKGKAYLENKKKVEPQKKYVLGEALGILQSFTKKKFDESIELAIQLGVDPKQSDQMVRGGVTLPHGLGKTIRVAVVARGEGEKEAREAGADIVGSDDIIEKIEKGWLEFDRIICTPETLKDLSKVAKVLGPKGLMPNKKTGTVTSEIRKTVEEQKKGKVEFKIDKSGIIHAAFGKFSFGADKLRDNFLTLYEAIAKAKPTTSKGIYVRKISISSTMSPGIKIDIQDVENSLNKVA